MQEVSEFFKDVGTPTGILVFVGWALWYVLRRLFNKTDGLLTNVAAKHIAFLDSHIASMGMTAKTMDVIAEKINETSTVVIGNSLSHAALHRAADHACDVVDRLCEKLECDTETRESRKQLRYELSRKGE